MWFVYTLAMYGYSTDSYCVIVVLVTVVGWLLVYMLDTPTSLVWASQLIMGRWNVASAWLGITRTERNPGEVNATSVILAKQLAC